MPRSFVTIALVSLIAAVSGCTDANSVAGPAEMSGAEADLAKGTGKRVRLEYVAGTNVVDNYEFSAESFSDGTVKGTFNLRQKRFDPANPKGSKVVVKVSGNVVCLGVDGNRARLGGIVTTSSFEAGVPVGSYVTWSVSDNEGKGKGSDGEVDDDRDTASPLLGSADPRSYCALGAAFPETILSRGQISVNPDVHAVRVRIKSRPFGDVLVDEYSLRAKRRGDGITGKFNLYQLRMVDGVEEAVVIATGVAECVNVVGNQARVGGRIVTTTFPEGLPVGGFLIWSLTDNGVGGGAGDMASQALGHPDPFGYCAAGLPYPESVVEKGQVKVRMK